METFEQFINRDEIGLPRTPQEYILWFESKLRIIKENRDDLKKQIILHEGVAKYFHEELFPLYRLLQNKAKDWERVKFIPIMGNQNFDVKVPQDEECSSKYFEIVTTDMNGSEYNRREYFLEYKSADLLGKVEIKRKPERKIAVESVFVQEDQVNQVQKDRIASAISKKLKVINREPHTALVVYFDDYTYFRFDAMRSKGEMDDFLDALSISWGNIYESLYIVGSSGKSFWERVDSMSANGIDSKTGMN